jgi:transposase-like protein
VPIAQIARNHGISATSVRKALARYERRALDQQPQPASR